MYVEKTDAVWVILIFLDHTVSACCIIQPITVLIYFLLFLSFSISSSLILWSTQSGIVLIINESNRNKNIFATGSKKFPFRCLSMLHSPSQEAQEMVIKSQKQSCQSPMLLLVPGFRKYRDTLRSNALAFVFLPQLCRTIIHFSSFFFSREGNFSCTNIYRCSYTLNLSDIQVLIVEVRTGNLYKQNVV